MRAIFHLFDKTFEPVIDWAFATKTRAFEIFNSTLFFTWAIAVIVDPGMFETSSYGGFGSISRPVIATAFLAMSIMSLAGVFSHKTDMRFLGGYSLFLSSFVWGLVSVGFIASYPPLTTDMVLYPQLSLLCFVVGRKIINDCAGQGRK